ncbi:MAG: prolipoprotein diacylglyceryl transferase [Candidatus Limiplasma sp.]|nr:prolipoprotein diacylglyceryl transferase [Candidatus Limiplasma sp.]
MAIPYSRYLVGNLLWYSVLMVVGILTAYLLGAREERRVGLPKDAMLDMVLIAVPCGIIGARLYYVLMSLDQFAAHPLSILYIWEGGIAIYGALIGGAIGVYLHCRVKKRNFMALLDISAPGLALAQAIVRWGNYFNREAYGPVIQNTAWQFFPVGVIIGEGAAQTWHVATFFYESVWNLATFGVLWFARKRMKRTGDAFLWYLVLYGSGRFLVEQLREDSLYLFGFRASQYLSLVLCGFVAVVFLIRLFRQQTGIPFAASFTATLVPLLRVILPSNAAGAVTLLLLAATAITLHGLSGKQSRLALLWLLADLALYLALLLTGLGWLWHSPYFLYAGLSIPVCLAFPYARLRGKSALDISKPQEG